MVVPYSFQYNFGFEYALPGNSLISVSYGHSQGRRLQCPFFFCGDQLSKETLAQGPTLLNTVPNPFYGIITDPSSALSRPTVQARVLQAGYPQFGGGGALWLPPIQGQRNFGEFNTEFPFQSNWNALVVGFEKRMSHGVQLLVAYTYSKNITNADSFDAG